MRIKKISWNTKVDMIVGLCILFLMLFSIWGLQQKEYYMVSFCILLLVLIPFFVIYEREIRLREILILVVMSAVSVVARISFFMLPQIKPVLALVIITGIALGKNAGFAIGAISVFVSNFYFGQGTHTPFQMVAMGLVGFFAGALFGKRKSRVKVWQISLFGFLGSIVYGFIVDLNTIFMLDANPTIRLIFSVYAVGLSMNLLHGISTSVFLFLLYEPVLKRLERMKKSMGFTYNMKNGKMLI